MMSHSRDILQNTIFGKLATMATRGAFAMAPYLKMFKAPNFTSVPSNIGVDIGVT